MSLKCCDIVNYIDDFAGAEYPELALKAYCILDKVLKSCGLLESVSKSVAPSCCMSFLGVLLNTLSMTLEVTQDRLKEILELLTSWVDKVVANKKEVQSLVGKLVFVAACVRPERIFISRMLIFLQGMPDNTQVELPF